MKTIVALCALLLSAGVAVHTAAAVPLPNAEAKTVLEAEHAAQSVFHLKIGALAVVGKDGKYAGPDAITERRAQEIRAWDHVGLVHTKADPAWMAFEQGKGDQALYNQKKEGVLRRIVVTAGPKAAQYRDPRDPNLLHIPMGNLVIDKVEENIDRRFGAGDYRVITFNGRIEFLPITAEYFLQFFAKKMKQEGRAIYLMKYEPATKSWSRIAADWADEQGQFKSTNVQKKLMELAK